MTTLGVAVPILLFTFELGGTLALMIVDSSPFPAVQEGLTARKDLNVRNRPIAATRLCRYAALG